MTSSFVRQILVKSVREAKVTVWSIEFETFTQNTRLRVEAVTVAISQASADPLLGLLQRDTKHHGSRSASRCEQELWLGPIAALQ